MSTSMSTPVVAEITKQSIVDKIAFKLKVAKLVDPAIANVKPAPSRMAIQWSRVKNSIKLSSTKAAAPSPYAQPVEILFEAEHPVGPKLIATSVLMSKTKSSTDIAAPEDVPAHNQKGPVKGDTLRSSAPLKPDGLRTSHPVCHSS